MLEILQSNKNFKQLIIIVMKNKQLIMETHGSPINPTWKFSTQNKPVHSDKYCKRSAVKEEIKNA